MGRILALTYILIFLHLGAFSQTPLPKDIAIEERTEHIKDLFTIIQAQTGFTFSYNSKLIDTKRLINLSPGLYSLQGILHDVFDNQGIQFVVRGEQIVLIPKPVSPDPITIEGLIFDSTSSFPLAGATVYFPELRQGVFTDSTGRFSILLRAGKKKVQFTLVGYAPISKSIFFSQDTLLYLPMAAIDFTLAEVTIDDQLHRNSVKQLKLGNERLDISNVQSMPAMFGEVDVLKSLQMLPGIQSAGEGLSGLLVRGGSSDQTMVMLNNATIYSPAHFLGFFSVFNPDAIEDVEVYKGGIPARWGGRLSSIINNNMREGSYEKFGASGGLGLISSRLSVEGPILKNRASFLLSGRRTYFDLLMKAVPTKQAQATQLFFYDLNSSVNIRLNKSNKLSLYTYNGDDVARFYDFARVKWGNRIISGNWLHVFNPKLLLSTSFHYSKYQYGLEVDLEDELEYEWSSRLKEYQLRMDFDYSINNTNQLNFGYNATRRTFAPITYRLKENNTIFGNILLDQKQVFEHALFIQNEQSITERLSFLYGLRYSFFHNLGPAEVFRYLPGIEKSVESISDTLHFKSNQIYNTYHGAEPRIVGRYSLTETSSLKVSYNRMQQFTQVASSATASLPQDRWIPADTYIKPQIGDQWSIGYFRSLDERHLDFSAELYYKLMRNQIDFKDGVSLISNVPDQTADLYLNNALETQLLSGKSWSYGAEFMVKKNKGPLTGWIAYTYSRTRRHIPGINRNKNYSPRYDRPHDLSIVGNYRINSRWEFAANWVYTSGSAVTLPEGKYNFEGKQIPYYNPDVRNNHRLADYHRLDLSLSLNSKKNAKKRWDSNWAFSLYNTYMRKNPLFIQFVEVINDDPTINENEVDYVHTKELKGVKVYFSLIPAISYNFRF